MVGSDSGGFHLGIVEDHIATVSSTKSAPSGTFKIRDVMAFTLDRFDS